MASSQDKELRLIPIELKLNTRDCDAFSLDRVLSNAENTRFPLELEVSGQDV